MKIAGAAAVLFLFVSSLSSHLFAGTLPPVERERIEALIRRVGELTDVQFVRNGRVYGASVAAAFLRRKWQAREADIGSVEEFIDKVASFSGTTGKPYTIRYPDGREIKSREFLRAELLKLGHRPAVSVRREPGAGIEK
ncbi:MAG TPA: DUF5329 family protein [candidate division Zixibacteria bacterium]|nr:DUF5329 family protein [candidate division Zixibacteria bacterium]